MCCAPVAIGERSRRTCRRAARCTTILTCGLGTARSIASITRSMYNVVSWPAETQPERRHHRQSKRQERGKRGAWIDPHGYDAGKKRQRRHCAEIKGKKRHVLVDTQGLLLHALVHSADIQDRDGGVLALGTLGGLHPFLRKLYADGGYQGPIFQSAVRKILRQIDVEIVKRSDIAKGFAVLPKRWIVERTIAWLNRCRRLAKDWECLNRKALAFLRLASIRLMLRKLCQKTS